MRFKATVTSEGTLEIPEDVREWLKLKQGDRLDIVVEDDTLIIRVKSEAESPFAAYVGVLDYFDDIDAINAWVRDLRDEP